MMPQNAQKEAIAVDRTTAIQPTMREAPEGGGVLMANLLKNIATSLNGNDLTAMKRHLQLLSRVRRHGHHIPSNRIDHAPHER